MFYATKTVGDFEVSAMRLVDGHVLHFTIKDPRPEIHKHENSMVVSGGMSIVTSEYSTTVGAGQSTKFTPRAGLTPFAAGTVSTLTAVGPTHYVCAKHLPGMTLVYDARTSADALVPGTLVVPTADYTLNGEQKTAGDFFVATEGDVLSAPADATVGVFTPT